jgi:hypothetical protein
MQDATAVGGGLGGAFNLSLGFNASVGTAAALGGELWSHRWQRQFSTVRPWRVKTGEFGTFA